MISCKQIKDNSQVLNDPNCELSTNDWFLQRDRAEIAGSGEGCVTGIAEIICRHSENFWLGFVLSSWIKCALYVYKYWNVLAKVVGATVFKVFLLTFSKCKFFLWFMITLMEFRYNNFGSELLDDGGGDIRLLCGPLSLRPADL